ncbi:MAG: LAGLIDADG family homing endonuclease [Jiangellaceae bacterium]
MKNKCLAAGTRVFDPLTGITHRIEDVVAGQLPIHVAAVDKAGQIYVRPVTSWFDQGEQDVVRVDLRGGSSITVTPDHLMLTERGWVPAGELTTEDRVARPRRSGTFGSRQPVSPDEARMLGYLIGDGYVGGKTIPTWAFADDIDPAIPAQLLFGLLESDGHVSAERTGAVRVGFTTTSEQLAHQIHWLLLRFGVTSSVRSYDPTQRRPSLIEGRSVRGERDCFEVRIAGDDNVAAFAAALPTWGPRSSALVEALAAGRGRHRGSQQVYLPMSASEPVLARLRERGLSCAEAAMMIGRPGDAGAAGFRQLLGTPRLRRDRVSRLADALDDQFLRDVLAEEISYAKVVRVESGHRTRTFDVEVEELHNLVAEQMVVHNCAPPFRQAEFDILYGEGISREGGLIDMGVEHSFVRKSGAWYTYEGDQLGQGKENARKFLRDNPDLADEIEKKIKEKLGVGPRLDAPVEPPVDF